MQASTHFGEISVLTSGKSFYLHLEETSYMNFVTSYPGATYGFCTFVCPTFPRKCGIFTILPEVLILRSLRCHIY